MPSQGLEVESKESSQGELQRDQTWRRERVSVAAYYCAERRRFEDGGDATDWHQAEAQIDAADEAGE